MTNEQLAAELERINEVATSSGLSLPGDPAWPIEQSNKHNAMAQLREHLVNNLPTILSALRPAEPTQEEADNDNWSPLGGV